MTPPRPHRDPPLVISFSPLSVTSSVVAHLSPREKTASYIAFYPLPPFRCFYCLLSSLLFPLLRGSAAASPAWQMVNAITHETLAMLLSKESIMFTAGEISLHAREWIAALQTVRDIKISNGAGGWWLVAGDVCETGKSGRTIANR